MRGTKRYTNATFTKRVDHDGGRHREERAQPEPALCTECGAVWADRRWTAAGAAAGSKHEHWRSPHLVLCPACRQQREGEPRGFVTLEGAFAPSHAAQVERLVRAEALRAAENNPLARILDWTTDCRGRQRISTTTEHLAQRLGHALQKAFGGEVDYGFSHENKLARVVWRRD